MIRLESSGNDCTNDCTMGASFRENRVYSTYFSLLAGREKYVVMLLSKRQGNRELGFH